MQHFLSFLLLISLGLPFTAASAHGGPTARADRWWAHVAALADDAMQGRRAGSPGHARAAAYVARAMAAAGLEPAGDNGDWLQAVPLIEQRPMPDASSLALVGPDGREAPLAIGTDLLVGSGGAPMRETIDAPLVFAGYGLHLPDLGHDDLAGLDIGGRIIVVVSGGPPELPAARKADARRSLARLVAERGGIGIVSLVAPGAMEVPWTRLALNARQPGMYLAEDALRDVPGAFFGATINPEAVDRLLSASGWSFARLAELAEAGRPLPRLDLRVRLQGRLTVERRAVISHNILGRLPGRDRRLAAEQVVLTAHVDGLGLTANEDRIFSGALDNAAGVASLIEMARDYRAKGRRPRRAILFAAVTAEERGLLGSRYLVERIGHAGPIAVANINLDMALPLWRLAGITALGAGESSLGEDARAVANRQGYRLLDDALPDRSSFVRSDQYSFIRAGVPALAIKFGFLPRSPEAAIEAAWRKARYHSPEDDLAQPVDRDAAVKLNDYVAALALRIANARARPAWNPDSRFKPLSRY